jgi:hypothetical protein
MMPDGSVPCPDCGRPVRPEEQQLCPYCDYPLLLLRAEQRGEVRAVPRAPGEDDDATAMVAGTAPVSTVRDGRPRRPAAAPPPRGELDCPRCGHTNAAERIRCEHCGHELRAVRPDAVALPPPAPVVVRGRRTPAWVVVLAAVAVVAVIAAAIALGSSILSGRRTGGTEPPASLPSAALERVDPATIRASASSTLPRARFRVENTLDGDPDTVWNSDGKKVGSNVGVALTYRFTGQPRVARITVVNGSARSRTNFAGNQRVAAFRVRTDAQEITWDLEDSVRPQSLALDPAPTGVVTLEVLKVYEGTQFPDLAVTDVAFDQVR